jgi:hypothetical protein
MRSPHLTSRHPTNNQMEIRMRSLNSATREKRVEGVNAATINERPAPPDQQGTFQLYIDDYPSFLGDVCSGTH